MRRLPAVVVACAAAAAWAQEPASRQEAGRIRELVEAGALPRKSLEEAESREAQARDEELLQATLYGQLTIEELTEEQAAAMQAAAERGWERQKKEVAAARRLIEEGALPRSQLTPYLEKLDRSRKTYDLAVTRARLLRQLAEIVRAEQELETALERAPQEALRIAERYDGDGVFHGGRMKTAILAFEKEFGKPMPVSARGATALHRSFGFDHRGRMDVALAPDSNEGIWLRRFLESLRVPYFAFRGAIPGRSTAPHIHIGPPSGRLARSD